MARDPALDYLQRRTRDLDRRQLVRAFAPAEIGDTGLRIFRAVGWPLLQASAIPAAFCMLVLAYLGEFVLPGLFLTSNPNSMRVQVTEVVLTIATTLFVAYPLLLLGVAYIQGFVTRITADFLMGRVLAARAAHDAARKSLASLVGLSFSTLLSASLVMVLALGLLLVSAVFADHRNAWLAMLSAVGVMGVVAGLMVFPLVLLRHAVAPAVVVLEGLKPRPAVRRGLQLTRGQFPHPSGYESLLYLAGAAILGGLALYAGMRAGMGIIGIERLGAVLAPEGPARSALIAVLGQVPAFVTLWVLLPFWGAGTTALYFDRRVRLEGYDIEVLAQDARKASSQSRFQL